jgi:NADH-quinone oxidoreductase subunit A
LVCYHRGFESHPTLKLDLRMLLEQHPQIYFLSLFTIIALCLSSLLLGLTYILAKQQLDTEKMSSYECGFEPFTQARSPFNIRFYLVSILFVIFDIEVIFLFPWAVSLELTSFNGFWVAFIFIMILTVGFVYEFKKKALEWE